MSFEGNIFTKNNSLIGKEELKKEKITSDFQADPAGFESELLSEMHRKREEVDAVLRVPEKFKLPKPMEYPKKCPIDNWEELMDLANEENNQYIIDILKTGLENKNLDISKYPVLEEMFQALEMGYSIKIKSEGNNFSEEFFQAIDEIIEKDECFNLLFQKIKERNKKPDIKTLESAFEVRSKIKSEKEAYIVSRLLECGVVLYRLNDDFFDRIKNIDIFEKVLSASENLKENDLLYADEVADYCEVIQNLGDDFLNVVLSAVEKTKKLKKQAFFKTTWFRDSVSNYILRNPYLCESLRNLDLEDAKYAVDILNKINLVKGENRSELNITEFTYFADLVKNGRKKIEETEINNKFIEDNNLKFSSSSEIISYLLYASDGFPLTHGSEGRLRKKSTLEYLKEKMPFLEEIAKDFKLENDLKVSISGLAGIHEMAAYLKFLSSRPDFVKFIKNNFEVKDLNHLSEIVISILKNRIDPKFESRIIAEKDLEGNIGNSNKKKKIENLFFLSKKYEPGFIYWLANLHKKTGFDVLKAISYGYTNSKIPFIKKWYENPKIFEKAISLGILGGEIDDQTREYSSNIYNYDAIANIFKDEKFLQFALDNGDLGILEKAIKSKFGDLEDENYKSIAGWYNDQENFSKAKQLGILGGELSKQTEEYNLNVYKYGSISCILKDEKFLQFALDNNDLGILREAINWNYGVAENEQVKSLIGWCNDSESFSRAKQLGILDNKNHYESNIFMYDKFACLGEINEKQSAELTEIFKSDIDKYLLTNNLKNIIHNSSGQSLYLPAFKVCLENGLFDEKDIENFPITKGNFCDYLAENETLIEIEKDRGLITQPIPWTKEWFLEDEKRFSYLNKDVIQTFKKFGTNIALAILGGAENSERLKEFYSGSVDKITRESERSTVLQLGEVFSLVISKGNFEVLDQMVDKEVPIGETFKKFVSDNEISEKGKTILTLLIAREINTAYYAKTENDIKSILKSVYEKLIKYNTVIDLYKKENIPEGLRTSIGMEYEVTKSIAEGYGKRTASDYKKDIEILSCYSGIAKGRDAIHEIATKPTDNPYLLLLEMKLLSDLDFVDLNFEHTFADTDYEKGSRSFHITLGGEFGIKNDGYANFIQNSLVAADLGGINAGEEVNQVNRYSNIRAKGNDCEKIFDNKTDTTEFRAFSIDRAESLERCVVSIFNLNMAKQALDKYTSITPEVIEKISAEEIKNIESFKDFCRNHGMTKLEINGQKIWEMIFNFVKIQKKILDKTEDHNLNFVENETIAESSGEQPEKRQNQKRFSSVIKSYGDEYDSIQKYMKEIEIDPKSFYKQIDSKLVNIFTKIHNLYLKPPAKTLADSVNAKSVFDSTKIKNENGTEYNESDLDAPKRTIFDNIDRGKQAREGRYYIQGSSEKMIINVIQQEILNFNREMKALLQK
ncbi:MAG TPA: hypothetical protein P5232_03780 [Candidatus Moranbacteria bacterium]|nr:hypothetical protein [Candidatus Moranbacteria bacterium]